MMVDGWVFDILSIATRVVVMAHFVLLVEDNWQWTETI